MMCQNKMILFFMAIVCSFYGKAQNKYPSSKDKSVGIVWNMGAGSIGYSFSVIGKKKNETYGIASYNYKKTPIHLVKENSSSKYVSQGRLYEAYGLEIGTISNFVKKHDVIAFSSIAAFFEYAPSYKYQFERFSNNSLQTIDSVKPVAINYGIKINFGANYFVHKNLCIGFQNSFNVSYLDVEKTDNNQNISKQSGIVLGIINPTISLRIYY